MRFTVCEQNSPAIKSFIEQNYVPWYSNVDFSSEWSSYASGLGSFTLPMICVIDPNDSSNYLDRTTGVQYANDFYSRLQSHITTYNLNLAKSGTGSGTVSLSNGTILCNENCNQTSIEYSPGEVVSLTATSATDSVFSGWSGGGCSGTGACGVIMNQTITVTASFSKSGGAIIVPQMIPLLLDQNE